MFGQKTTFGAAPTSGFGTFGAAPAANPFGATTSAFGQPQQQQQQSAFGASAFGSPAQQPATGGGLFGTPSTGMGGGLFGATAQPVTSTPGFGGFGATAPGTSTFGVSSAFKPAGSAFGVPSVTSSGGLFGTTTSQSTSSGLFGSSGMAFGGQTASPFGTTAAAFGQQQSPIGTTVKFNPPTGTDTMMKSGGQQSINTRHQCITCMKEYENKSIEELRFEDYSANRKGPGAGVTALVPGGGGLFGASQPSAGLFGAQPQQQQQQQQGGMFGQQNKPLFGAATTSAFGMPTASPFSTATSAFGATSTAGNTGLFGSKPAGFGATTTTSSSFGFGQPAATSGGLFGQAKPFGAAAPQQSGGLFGAPAPAFGATAAPAFGAANTVGTFGQPAPNQQIGLFGQPANKPVGTAFGTSFGAASTAAPAFGFGSTMTTTQANPFGQQNKPAFGFGAPTSAAPAFGAPSAAPAFGVAQPQQGGLFSSQPKPAFGFGAPTSQPSTGFGQTSAFNPSTSMGGGGLFGSAPQKPGGLFGNTPAFGNATQPLSTGFGAATGGFGSSFATNPGVSSFGFNSTMQQPQMFQQQQQLQQQPQAQQPPPIIHQQIEVLQHNPYGENSLFKNPYSDSKKVEEMLKPTNPAAQKALSSNQYKVSPLRNIKPKPKPISTGQHKSVIFDGLDEDDDPNLSKGGGGEMFVPRKSIKKLILNPKSPGGSGGRVDGAPNLCNSLNLSLTELNSTSLQSLDESGKLNPEDSYNLPPVPTSDDANKSNNVVDESFSALLSRKKSTLSKADASKETQKSVNASSDSVGGLSDNDDDSEDVTTHPAGIRLRRAGYYTIPTMSELANLTDCDGNCNVENFTVGRTGYGNIFFPGVTNIRNMNFDEIVFFRRKEVIVYPDDDKKPQLGDGLNRRAQVTLDKVWPVDKTKQEPIKSPEKLVQLNYEDKLQKACIKLGARFIEFRPETGSWVFRVDHFSKYGLDDSDEEEDTAATILGRKDVKKLKVVGPPQPVKSPVITLPAKTQHQVDLDTSPLSSQKQQQQTSDSSIMEDNSGSDSMLQLSRLSAPPSKVQMMKAALFTMETEDMDTTSAFDVTNTGKESRPIILEPRPTILEKRDKFIEDIAHSMLTGNRSKGLGGSFALENTAALTSSLLLRSQYLSHSGLATSNTPSSRPHPSSKLSRYTLQGGYDKYVSLPTQGGADTVKPPIAPQHAGRLLPFSEAILGPERLHHFADAGLFMGRTFRVGWGVDWSLANVGNTLSNVSLLDEVNQGPVSVNIENLCLTSYGGIDDEQLNSLESWLTVYLSFTDVTIEEGVPKAELQEGQDALHAHADQAAHLVASSEGDNRSFNAALLEWQHVWDLCIALWGKLSVDGDAEEGGKQDSHEMTMLRREAFSKWLEGVVETEVQEDLRKTQTSGDHIDQVLALLSGNKMKEACDKAQNAHDHYAVMLASQSSGNNCFVGQLTLQQLDRWQEAKADKFIDNNRLSLFAHVAGVPVWPGSETAINTCEDLDWLRCLGQHLWYFTSPSASIADALSAYEEAFMEGDTQFGVYAASPKPSYADSDEEVFDIKFQLMKLYANRTYPLERIVTPVTHTPDHLDHRLGWFVAQVLRSLGYRHLSEEKRDRHHAEFASQLESLGMWHWSVFVLLHLSDATQRRACVKDVLGRHVKLGDHESSDREVFLQDQLDVPLAWIAEAKAMSAATAGDHGDQAWYLIKAELYNQAHEVTIKWIAPDAIINDDYDFFHGLLKDLAEPNACKQIVNWDLSGKLFYDFINVDLQVQKLVQQRDEATVGYHIEQLKPQVLSLCSRVSSLVVTSAKERLCQSEISKKIAHILRAVLSLEGEPSSSAIMAHYLGQLPLPDDYELQELRNLNRSYMRETMENL